MRRPSHTLSVSLLVLLLAAAPANPQVFQARAGDGKLLLTSSSRGSFVRHADGTRLELPVPVTAAVTSFAAAGGKLYAAAVDRGPSGRRLVVVEGVGTKARELLPPEVRETVELREPALLVDETGLRALAWLEGPAPRRQVLRVARRGEGGWQSPETVSPRGAGSQMALATAYLGQGTWILAWAAYDGDDDEILWSRFRLADGASVPARVAADNEVPDIVPHLAATPAGVLLAWNHYDGSDYRVSLARFTGDGWTKPAVAGPKGSLYPKFHATGTGTLLVYQLAVPRGWVVAELDRSANVLRTATVETGRAERPAVGDVTARQVSLWWLGDDAEPSGAVQVEWRAAR